MTPKSLNPALMTVQRLG